jgi:hypothetical protein
MDQIPVSSACERGVGHPPFIKGEIFFTVCRLIISLPNGMLSVFFFNERHTGA